MKKKTYAEVQRPPAEVRFAAELTRLKASDKGPRPPGWQLSLPAVRAFIAGDRKRKIAPKFVGGGALIDRAMVSLATNRGLLLIGEPGTAKSYLSELLCAAISGSSTLTIQGGAATSEDQIKYTWNYALLINEGPSPRALVPAPLHLGMTTGSLVRFEEITRCPAEVQDALLSVLSDRVLAIPELGGDEGMLFARPGFNLIATANTRDRGVNEMSAALKRRFNFETVHPIADFEIELDLVERESAKLLLQSGVPKPPERDVLEVLVTTFRELRNGFTADGHSMERLNTVMSTAEAVSVAHAAGVQAWFLRSERATPADFVDSLAGVAVKDDEDDLVRVRSYLGQRTKGRRGAAWRALYAARDRLGGQ